MLDRARPSWQDRAAWLIRNSALRRLAVGESTVAPEPRRIYAIGDIHGCRDLLDRMIEEIRSDLTAYPVDRALTVTLGDYVDRGPDLRGVVERLAGNPFPTEFVALKGNHEDMLVRFLRDPSVGDVWSRNGGLETLHSYGIDVGPMMRGRGYGPTAALFEKALPPAHAAFFASLRVCLSLGRYFFCHAGVRPGVPFKEQREHDLLWIRDEFLRDRDRFRKDRRAWAHAVADARTPPEPHQCRYRRVHHRAADLRRAGSGPAPVSLGCLSSSSGHPGVDRFRRLARGRVLRNLIRFGGDQSDMLDRVRGLAKPRCFAVVAPRASRVAICLLLSACGGGGAPSATPADLDKVRAAAAAPPQLQAGEKIRVTVFGENSLSGEYQIDPSGFVSLPLAGTVKAAGLTQNDLARELEASLRSGYLKDPKVTVSITRIPPVLHPGRGRKAGFLPVFEWLERHERHCDRRRHDVPGEPVDGADPACRGRRDARL